MSVVVTPEGVHKVHKTDRFDVVGFKPSTFMLYGGKKSMIFYFFG